MKNMQTSGFATPNQENAQPDATTSQENMRIHDTLWQLVLSDDIAGLAGELRRLDQGGAQVLFLESPEHFPKTSSAINFALNHLSGLVETACTQDADGKEHLVDVLSVLEAYGRNTRAAVFVYGTLLSGMGANGILSTSGFAGKVFAPQTFLYDLGPYPALSKRRMHDDHFGGPICSSAPGVMGEAWLCDSATLRRLAQYEGEGYLYDLKPIVVTGPENEPMDAYAYFYRFEENGHEEMPVDSWIPLSLQPYSKLDQLKQTHVWYVAYGSNILFERFRCYIEGGTCRFNGRSYAGCRDTSLPLASVAMEINHDIYFGNRSGSWGDCGAAFLDTSAPGWAIGRAYLITKEQLLDVQEQECASPHWYPDAVNLGMIAGVPAVTLTNKQRRQPNPPSKDYLHVMSLGVQETLWNTCDTQSDSYIKRIASR